MKMCNKCKEEKPLTSFIKKRSGNRGNTCRRCKEKKRKENKRLRKIELNKVEKIKCINGKARIRHLGGRWEKLIPIEEAGLLLKIGCAEVQPEGDVIFSNNSLLKNYVLERDKNKCAYCGKFGDTVDHVVPKSEGGIEIPSNYITACLPCNEHKSSYTLEEFLMMDESRIKHFNSSGYANHYNIEMEEARKIG